MSEDKCSLDDSCGLPARDHVQELAVIEHGSKATPGQRGDCVVVALDLPVERA